MGSCASYEDNSRTLYQSRALRSTAAEYSDARSRTGPNGCRSSVLTSDQTSPDCVAVSYGSGVRVRGTPGAQDSVKRRHPTGSDDNG